MRYLLFQFMSHKLKKFGYYREKNWPRTKETKLKGLGRLIKLSKKILKLSGELL